MGWGEAEVSGCPAGLSGLDGQMDKRVDRWTSGWRPVEGSLSRATLERMDALLSVRRTDVTAEPRRRRSLCVLCCPRQPTGRAA